MTDTAIARWTLIQPPGATRLHIATSLDGTTWRAACGQDIADAAPESDDSDPLPIHDTCQAAAVAAAHARTENR